MRPSALKPFVRFALLVILLGCISPAARASVVAAAGTPSPSTRAAPAPAHAPISGTGLAPATASASVAPLSLIPAPKLPHPEAPPPSLHQAVAFAAPPAVPAIDATAAPMLQSSGSSGTLVVEGMSNIFAAGQTTMPSFGHGDGLLPPGVAIGAGNDRILSFSSVTGIASCCGSPPNPPTYGPDGTTLSLTNISSRLGISGLYHASKDLFLAGVFLDDATPQETDTPPAILGFSTNGSGGTISEDFTTLAPLLRQTFFIGDGLTGTGSGSVQQFEVPDGATRLYLGFVDGQNLGNGSGGTPSPAPPGWYSDNRGEITANYVLSVESTVLPPGQTRNTLDPCNCDNAPPVQFQTTAPVNTRTGNYWTSVTDLAVQSPGPALVWTRTYNSQAITETTAVFGYGWQHSYATQLITPTLEPGRVIILSSHGNELRYEGPDTNGDYTAWPGIYSTLVRDGDVFTQTLRNQAQLVFDAASGRLLKQRDPLGRWLILDYDTGVTPARLEAIQDATTSERALTLSYTDDRLTSVSDGVRMVSYAYDADDNLSSVANVMGRTTTYEYQTPENHLVTGVIDPLGQAVERMGYSDLLALPKVITQTLQDDRELQFNYLANTTLVTTTGRDGRSTVQTIGYNGNNTMTGLAINNQPVLATTFDAGFSPGGVADGKGNTTQTTYRSDGLPLARTNALGQVSRMLYDTQNRPISMTDALGITTLIRYDSASNVISNTVGVTTTSPIRATALYTYTYLNDSDQWVTSVPAGGALDSRLVAQRSPDGIVTTYTYDSDPSRAHRVTEVTFGAGSGLEQVIGYGYDTLGRVITTTVGVGSALERTDTTLYNADNTIARTILNYQGDGVFDAARPDENITTSYGYDLLGRTVAVTDTLGNATVTHYNAAGQVDWTARNLRPLEFDAQGQPIYQPYTPDQPDANVATLYGYDGLGRTVLVSETGILTGEVTYSPPLLPQFTGTYTEVTKTEYDALSRPMTVTLNYRPGLPSSFDTNIKLYTRYDAAGNVITQTDALGRWTVTQYDALNRPITETLNYQDGNPLTGARDADVKSVTRYDAAGRVRLRIDNAVNEQFSATEPITDRVTLYAYDTLSRVVTTTVNYAPSLSGPDLNRVSVAQYDPATTRLAGQRDSLGRWSRLEYDPLGRVQTMIQNCTGGSAPQGCGSATNDENVPFETHYDALGRAFEAVDALDQATRTTYDGLGRPIATTQNYVNAGPVDQETNVTTSSGYDGLGRTVVMTNALGFATHYTVNALGQTTVMTDSVGRVTQMGYDGQGMLRWIVRADGQLTVTQVDGLGRARVTIVNYHDGLVGAQEPVDQDLINIAIYDQAGRRLLTVDPAERRTAFVYDNLDRMTMVGEYGPPETCPIWMVCNLPKAVTQYAYDRAGNRTAIVDANSHARRFTYDAANQQRQVIDPLGYTTVYTYDQGGRLTYRGGPRGGGNQLAFTYDGLDHLIGTNALNVDQLSPISAEYDALGRRTLLEDGSGSTSFAYDALGRMTGVQITPAGQPAQTIGYGYDAHGARTTLIYTDSTQINYDYWPDGQLQQVTQGTGTPSLLASYSYDSIGRPAHVARSNGAVTSYSYDDADRMRRITTSVGGATAAGFEYAVDRLGLRTAITETLPLTLTGGFPVTSVLDDFNRANGAPGSDWVGASGTYNIEDNALTNVGGDAGALFWDTSFGAEQEIAFTLSETDTNGDEIDLLLKGQSTSPCDVIEVLYQPRSSTVQVWTCHNYGTWLAHGAPINVTLEAGDRFGARVGADGTVTIYQNEQAIGSVVISSDWPYRAEGGRIGVWLLNAQGAVLDDFSGGTITPPPPPTPTRVTTYNYDGLLRLIGAQESPGTTYAYSYDSAGNQTGQWVNGTRTITRTYNAANQVVGWSYDQAGNLIGDGTATYSYDALNRMTAGDSTSYAYNGDGVLMAQTTSGVTTRYTQDLAAPLSQVLHITQGNSTTRSIYGLERLAAESGGTNTWYVADALGSVRRTMSDVGEPGSPVYYDPWGKLESGGISTFGFTGEMQNTATDLVYLRARWYHTGNGTFTSKDPFVGFPARPYSSHPYQYAYSNPLLNRDPSGRCMPLLVVVDGPLPIGDAVALVTCLMALGAITAQNQADAVSYYSSVPYQGGSIPLYPGPPSTSVTTASVGAQPMPAPGPALPAPGTLTPPTQATPTPVPSSGTGGAVQPVPTPSSALGPASAEGVNCDVQAQTNNQRRNSSIVVELGPGVTILNLQALAARYPNSEIYGVDNTNALLLEVQLSLAPNKRIHILDRSYAIPQGTLQNQASVVVAVAPNPGAPILTGIRNFIRPGGQVLVLTDQEVIKNNLVAALGYKAALRRVSYVGGPQGLNVVTMTSIGVPLVSHFYDIAPDDQPWEIFVPAW